MVTICIGLFSIAKFSLISAVLYIAIILIFTSLIIYSFCAKCDCRLESCSHVFPGKMTKLFPDRKQTKYSNLDRFITSLSLVFILIFPQLWLWKIKFLFILFWVLFLAAVAEILLFVCKNCNNQKCPVWVKGNCSKNL